jgi:carbamoyltransferase
LADPRNTKMRDYLNKEVKHREMFRPFAPAILENKSNQFFDINYSPYMLQVAKAKKYKKIKSVCHVDKTARVQTVNKYQNKNFYNIIRN